jgi:hypothetical protein
MTEQTRAAQPPSARRRSKQVHTCAHVRACVRACVRMLSYFCLCVRALLCACAFVCASRCVARLVVPTGLAANTLPACAEIVDAERGHRALLQSEVLHHVPAESGPRCGRVTAKMHASPGQMWASPGQMWASPGADVGEVPAEGACPCWLVDAMRTRSLALNSAATCAEQCWATSAPGVGHICAGTRPHLHQDPPHLRRDSPTSAPGLAHICAGTRPHLRRDSRAAVQCATDGAVER